MKKMFVAVIVCVCIDGCLITVPLYRVQGISVPVVGYVSYYVLLWLFLRYFIRSVLLLCGNSLCRYVKYLRYYTVECRRYYDNRRNRGEETCHGSGRHRDDGCEHDCHADEDEREAADEGRDEGRDCGRDRCQLRGFAALVFVSGEQCEEDHTYNGAERLRDEVCRREYRVTDKH